MEDARKDLELVHVLRHSFRPSQPLAESIENFIKPGRTLPRLSLYGTKEVAVDLLKYNDFKYKKEEDEAREKFKKHTEAIFIDPVMRFRKMSSAALRLGFIPTPESTPVFNDTLATLDGIPNLLAPYSKFPRYFLYIDIPNTHLVEEEQLGKAYFDLRRALSSRIRAMYLVRPEDVVGQDGKRHLIPIEERPQDIEPFETDPTSLVTPL